MTSAPFLRRVGQLALLPVLGFSAVLLCAALLVSLRLEKAVGDLVEERGKLISVQLTEVIEGGMHLGIPMADQSETPEKMRALISNDVEVETIAIFDDAGKLLIIQHRDGASPQLDQRIVKRALTHRPGKSAERSIRTWRADGKSNIVAQARDASGSTGAVVWVVYSANTAQVAFSTTFDKLLQASSAMVLVSVLLLFGSVFLIWHRWEQHVTHTQAGMAEPPGTQSGTARTNPLPAVPLSEALIKLAHAEGELALLDLKMTALLE
jgi:hypothetical protein